MNQPNSRTNTVVPVFTVNIVRHALTAAMAFGAFGCATETGTSESETGGTLVIALPVEPRSLLPPLITLAQEKQIADQVYDVLAQIGPELNTLGDAGWTPRLAESWQWAPDSMSIAFKLRPGARFHDGHPVTSTDVRFSLELYKDPKIASRFASGFVEIDSISTPDSLTAVVWYSRRSPEQFYNFVYNLLVMPEHALRGADRTRLDAHPLARQPLGSGPFRFVRWDARTALEVAADTSSYEGRARLNRIIWVLAPDNNTALNTVLAAEADLFETLSPDAMAQVAGNTSVRALGYASTGYAYLGFNMRDPADPARPHALFADKNVRRALAMAINRPVLMKNVYDSLAYLGAGPFSRNLATADTSLPMIAFDSTGADQLLDSSGWKDSNGDGVRDKAGRALRFTIHVPTSSPPRRRYAELIQAQLRAHGVRVDVEAEDVTVLGPRLFAGQFDAVVNSWLSDPSPITVRDSWHTPTSSKRGNNFQSYSNPAVDASIDSAIAEPDPAKARAHYRSAYRGIIDDVPSVWLYENRMFMALHNRVQPVFNGRDVWWRELRLWSIPADQRLPRDK